MLDSLFTVGHEEDDTFLRLRDAYANCLYTADRASRDDLAEAVAILGELIKTAQRIYGAQHPFTNSIQTDLKFAQERLASFDK